ncbi:hypothetical protein BU23DRAFT_575284 [Bimuria novae-zelandiae CBS 107.79]|uniref:F-box domain-containing protein n=1 Tax=Bimuria novae-zelandiae CBS 107.79 TaxID=1447943 RepID=A0A6A5UJX6_9PLEO|nr:hypothetical protein BU23DRAFT_575284 [Bimuria novae-zelandiae CBS 107.79]
MGRLTDLPVELLQRIAGFLDCSSALSLTRTSRQLNDACNVRTVFKDIALYLRGTPLNDVSPISKWNPLIWPNGPGILKRASLSDTIRVAYAVEQALHQADKPYNPFWNSLQADISHGVQCDIEQWLPQLLAWHHPTSEYLQYTSLLPVHYQLGQLLENQTDARYDLNKANFINVGFCLAFLALQNLSKIEDECENGASVLIMSGDYMLSVCWGLRTPYLDGYGLDDDFDLAQASSCIFPFLYSVLGDGYYRTIPFPLPSKMPFSSLMDIPWVYSGGAEAFTTCHVEKMTEPGFLTGTWMGYYTDQRTLSHQALAPVDHPMEEINIVAASSSDDSNESKPNLKGYIQCPQSHGIDRYGKFTLGGSFYANGQVEFVKKYCSHNWEWQYRGVVIPFGIAGHWSSTNNAFGGYFWIWKKEWCDALMT